MTDSDQDLQQNNMISNLPLIFANGYPTSLERISEVQLQRFIPFMVQCSLGHINLQDKVDCSEPEWWPEEFPFNIPFNKPKKFKGSWMDKMKEIVVICYTFHKSLFLLRFCNDLASYEHASLRFINNYNSTTSLFDRRSNKLLVTFRNENMSYDQPQRSRKTLLQQKSKNGRQTDEDSQHIMVEPAPFDIYLCDSCDAELYSKDAILEHEKTCNVEEEDNDVILCDTPEPYDTPAQREAELHEQQNTFLMNFNLHVLKNGGICSSVRKTAITYESSGTATPLSSCSTTHSARDDNIVMHDKSKRLRRNRVVSSLTRCPMIPLSSPGGQLILRTTRSVLTPEYRQERHERIERFCHAPPLPKNGIKPKFFERKSTQSVPHCTFKRPQDYSQHIYGFPRRQFSQRRKLEQFLVLNSPLIKRCRPISVKLKKLNESEMMKPKRPRLSTTSCDSSNSNDNNTLGNNKINIKLTRDSTRNSANWKISTQAVGGLPVHQERIVDTIDLCSSDEEHEQHQQIISPAETVELIIPQLQCQPPEPQPQPEIILPHLSPPPLISTIDTTATNIAINGITTSIFSNESPCLPLLDSLILPTSNSKVEYAKKRFKCVNIKDLSLIPIRKATVNNCNNNSISSNNNININKIDNIGPPPLLKLMSNVGIGSVAAAMTNAKNLTTSTTFNDNNNLLLTPTEAQIIGTSAIVAQATIPNGTPAAIAALSSTSLSSSSSSTENNNCTTATGIAQPQILLPQPLRPSVYIFSNYTTNPLTTLVSAVPTTNDKLLGNAESVAFRNDNQENKQQQQQQVNQQQNNALVGNATSIVTKCSNNVVNINATNTSTWFADTNAAVISQVTQATSSHNSSVENIVSSPLIERDCGSKNIGRVQNYGSPGCIVSIDLTI